MRIMEGFHLRQIAGEMIAVPTGPVATQLSGLAVLNETAHFLFALLQTEQTEETLVEALLNEYDTDRDTAIADVRAFVNDLRDAGVLIEKEEIK